MDPPGAARLNKSSMLIYMTPYSNSSYMLTYKESLIKRGKSLG